jgi:hypothetical protein
MPEKCIFTGSIVIEIDVVSHKKEIYMATKPKTKKIVTPEKDIEVPVSFSSPLDMQEHKVDKAPALDMQMSVEQMEKMQEKYRNEMLGTVVCDSEASVDDIILREYKYCTYNITGPQRAILSELVRIRRALESK